MADMRVRRNKNRVEMPVEQARKDIKNVLNSAEFRGERTIITRYGKPSAAVVSIADLEKIEAA